MNAGRTVILALAAWALSASAVRGAEPPRQLIRDVVYNEMHDHERHGYWAYFIQKRVGQESRTEEQVETREGPVHRLLTTGGRPLTPVERQREEERLSEVVTNPREQRAIRDKYLEDEKRIGRIMNLLPEAFTYEYDGVEGDDIRLRFQPNPDFNPSGYEARVFHAMGGRIWISKEKRLARLEGHLIDDVVFGYGILGRLNKGGSFDLERVQVSATDWKTHVLDVHISGKAILFKTIAKDTHEVRSHFREIARETTVVQAKSLLDEDSAHFEALALQAQPPALLVSSK